MKSYSGSRTIDGIVVSVDGQPLGERYDVRRFTDSGFEWTYEGDAPRQLALALLADHFGDADKALELCEGFMKAKIAHLENDWTMTSEEIDSVLNETASA